MKVITLLNEKGGCGKTTLSTGLARLFHDEHGYRVLIIDGDQQGHTTLSFKVPQSGKLYNLLVGDSTWNEVLYPLTSEGRFWIVPGGVKTFNLVSSAQPTMLQRALEALPSNLFDFVIIDSSPATGNLHTAWYHASDYVIFPTECHMFSVEGVKKSLSHLKRAGDSLRRNGLQCAEPLAIVPNLFNGRESVQYTTYGWLQGHYGNDFVLTPIRQRTAWKQAAQSFTGVHDLEPSGQAAKEARRFAREVLAKMEVYHA